MTPAFTVALAIVAAYGTLPAIYSVAVWWRGHRVRVRAEWARELAEADAWLRDVGPYLVREVPHLPPIHIGEAAR